MEIKELRKELNWTQKDLSDNLGIPKRTLEDWENDRRTPPIYVEKLIIEKLERILEDNRTEIV